MVEISKFERMNPYIRMMRLKRTASLSGKWQDIDHVFTYIASGTGDFIIDGNRYSLGEGNVIVLPPYKTHIIISQGEEPLVQYIIHFDFFETPERVKLMHQRASMNPAEHMIPEEEKVLKESVLIAEIPEAERNDVRRTFHELFREFEERRIGREMMLKAGCIQLLTRTLRAYMVDDKKLPNLKVHQTKSWMHVENTIRYINTCDMKSDLNNDTIAEAIGVSPNYLTKVFQEYLGMSLHKYIVSMRVEKAHKLLLTGKVNITEAAEGAGFSGIHVFSKTFKSRFGITPSEFLNQIVNRDEINEEK